LLEHNCNNFSNELAQILLGKSIPQHILDLPREVLNSPIGPMLRPFLEQAADPLHLHKTGQFNQKANAGLGFLSGGSGGANVQQATTSSSNAEKKPEKEQIPKSVEQFNEKNFTKLSDEFKSLIWHCESNNLLSVNEQNLLGEIRDYLAQKSGEVKWSLGKNHLKLLIELYSNKLKQETAFRLSLLSLMEHLALNLTLAESLVQHELFKNEILHQIKSFESPDLKLKSFELLSNLCTHCKCCFHLLEHCQEVVCKDLVDFILLEAKTDLETLLHEASISFFYNLISAYHLEGHLDAANALAIGVALLERLPKFQSNKETTYRMLALLRSCLVKSSDVRDLAHSMDFSMADYLKQQQKKSDTLFESNQNQNNSDSDSAAVRVELEKNDTYESIVNSIDQLIHEQNH
jgi:hypothetical protein